MAADQKSMPFIKHLASSDRKVRTKALTTLKTFLTASTTSRALTPLETLKLWKGLFYSLWMCDRPLPQQKLCDELAGLLLDTLPDDDEVAGQWLAAFWETMSREWTGIDVYRMEKFLLLVPVGLRLHVLDIWVDEVEKAGILGDEEGSTAEDEEFLNRIRDIVEEQSTNICKPVRAQAKESLEDERLPWNKISGKDEDMKDYADDQDSWEGFDD